MSVTRALRQRSAVTITMMRCCDHCSKHHQDITSHRLFPDKPLSYVAQTTLYTCGPPLRATTINDALTQERPRPVRGFTTAVKKRPSASELSRTALSKQHSRTQRLSRATATTDARQKERKRNGKSRAMQGAAVNNAEAVFFHHAVSFDSCCDPMLQDHSIIDAM